MAEHALLDRSRQRSLGFLQWEDATWACFLVTFLGRDHQFHGYLSFRPRDCEGDADLFRTADIFVEVSEAEIDQKARGLGRPLLLALLSSAAHTHRANDDSPTKGRRWFRNLLSQNSRELKAATQHLNPSKKMDMGELCSLYASYRLDQVCHFIALVKPENFETAVDSILEGQRIDFGSKDRLQLAMMVVEYIESRIPMPPFELWAEDFIDNRDEYLLYSHTLHREGRLP